jgi:hypothetical protein
MNTTDTVVISVYDAYNNISTSYVGTIHFIATDSQATLPGDYTFVLGDSGTHIFSSSVKFLTSGAQTITVSDSISGVSGVFNINITDTLVDPVLEPVPDSRDIETATKETNNGLSNIVTQPREAINQDSDNVKSIEQDTKTSKEEETIVNTSNYDKNSNLNYEDNENKYKKQYNSGKYKTTVIVFEGKVVAAPYDEKGARYDQGVSVIGGSKFVNQGMIP